MKWASCHRVGEGNEGGGQKVRKGRVQSGWLSCLSRPLFMTIRCVCVCVCVCARARECKCAHASMHTSAQPRERLHHKVNKLSCPASDELLASIRAYCVCRTSTEARRRRQYLQRTAAFLVVPAPSLQAQATPGECNEQMCATQGTRYEKGSMMQQGH